MLLAFTVTPPSGGLAVTAVIEKQHATAPSPVNFRADVAGQPAIGAGGYDAQTHEIEFLWDFYYTGGDSSYTFANVSRLPAAYQTSRYARGRYAAHVYRQAFTGTARVYAYKPSTGEFGSADVSVTVGDEDALYPTTNTIFVSPSGNFTGGIVPTGAQTVTESNPETVMSTYVYGNTNPTRVIFRNEAGYTGGLTGQWGTARGNSLPDLLITTRGAGAKPVFTQSGNRIIDDTGGNQDKSVKIQGIRFVGAYDDENAATSTSGIPFWFLGGTSWNYMLWENCEFDGTASVAITSGQVAVRERSFFFNDCLIENQTTGSLAYDYDHFNVVGTKFHASPNAIINHVGGSGRAFRIQGDKTIFQNSDLFRKGGWSLLDGTNYAIQPVLRFQYDNQGTSGPASVLGAYYGVSGCLLECGRNIIQIRESETGPEKNINGVFEENIFIGGYQSDCLIDNGCGGLTLRTNIFYMPNLDTKMGLDFTRVVKLEVSGANATNTAGPIRIYSNSLVNNLDTSKNIYGTLTAAAWTTNSAGFTDITTQNNLDHQPRSTPAATTYAPIARVDNDYVPQTGTYRDTSGEKAQYAVLTTTGDFDTPTPQSGSSAIAGVVSGLSSAFAFPRVLRTDVRATSSIGAIE